MRSRRLALGAGLAALGALGALGGVRVAAADGAAAEPLRVCADPNNLPYSDRSGGGYENALAELVAESLGRSGVAYTWRPQRRGFVRNTLNAGRCEIVMGVPVGYELTATTRPYYYSTYVFVTRDADHDSVSSIDDPILRRLRIGVPVVGDDYSSTPGEKALGNRGIIDNVVGYSIYGDYSKPHPTSNIIDAVASGQINVALAWGPVAGYFAAREPVRLTVSPVLPHNDGPTVPFVFGMAMGVKHGNDALLEHLNRFIATHQNDIRKLLERYDVPLVDASAALRLGRRQAVQTTFTVHRPDTKQEKDHDKR